MKTAADIIKAFESVTGRSGWDSLWQELIDYYMPNRLPITGSSTSGTNTSNSKRYDSSPVRDAKKFSNILHSIIANRALQWFLLRLQDRKIGEEKSVKEWLEKSQKALKQEFDNSNFHEELGSFLLDASVLSTSVMFTKELLDKEAQSCLSFKCIYISEVFFVEDTEGNPEKFFRKFKLNAAQVEEKFPEHELKSVNEAIEEKKYDTEFTFIHAVFKREGDDYKKNSINSKQYKWASFYVFYEEDKDIVVQESGYQEQPFSILRLGKRSNEKYGSGLGVDNLDDVKTLSKAKLSLLNLAEKIGDPSLTSPDNNSDLDFSGGGISYYDPSQPQSKPEYMRIDASGFPVTKDVVQDLRDGISEGFYLNMLSLIDKHTMTIPEIRQRTEENARVIGPLYGQTVTALATMVYRAFSIALRAGKLPKAPPILKEGMKYLDIKYTSPIAKAQQMQDAKAITYTIDTAFSWAERNPEKAQEILDPIDFDESLKKIADLDGAPESMFKDPKLVKKIRAARDAQRAEAMQLQAQNQQADTANKAGSALKNVKQGAN